MPDVGHVRPPAPARLRILATADELFYNEGIHTVGVDRIIAAASVTKATFYKHFRAKDRLIVEYVAGRDRTVREFFSTAESDGAASLAVLRSLVGAITTEATRRGFHGCPFINAAAQFTDPAHPVRLAVADHRTWYRGHIRDLMSDLGHPRPDEAADDLLLARDGALGGGPLGDPPAIARALRRTAERIFAEAGAEGLATAP